MASLYGYDQEIKPDPKSQRKSKTPNECQMIDSSLLKIDQCDECKPKPRSELEDFKIYGDDDDRVIRIGVDLEPKDKAQLKNLIEQYKDIFARTPTDMPRIDISVSCHKLLINKNAKPVW